MDSVTITISLTSVVEISLLLYIMYRLGKLEERVRWIVKLLNEKEVVK